MYLESILTVPVAVQKFLDDLSKNVRRRAAGSFLVMERVPEIWVSGTRSAIEKWA